MGEIPPLGTKDFYYETVQPHGKSIKILLPEHRNGFMNIKTKASLKDTLKCYSFNRVFLNCTCRITFDNIQDLLDQPGTQYTVYHGAHKCRSNNCTLSKDVSSQSVVRNQFVSQDTVTDRCEILAEDPNLRIMTLFLVHILSTLESVETHRQARCISSIIS